MNRKADAVLEIVAKIGTMLLFLGIGLVIAQGYYIDKQTLLTLASEMNKQIAIRDSIIEDAETLIEEKHWTKEMRDFVRERGDGNEG
jgi:hypothetical protein